MDGYAASLYSPIRLSIFSNTNTEKIWKADTEILGMNVLDVKIPMMESEIHDLRIVHAKQHKCLVMEIPTTIPNIDLIIFLPFNSSLEKVEEVFGKKPEDGPVPREIKLEKSNLKDAAALDKIIAQLSGVPKTKNVKIFMPSFSILDEAELKDIFVTLGSNDLLDSTRADLTGIIKVNDDMNSRLSLEHFVYKTRVDITGTSDELSDDLTGTTEAEISIVVDRPFLFVLRNSEYNVSNLVGKVENPSVITSSKTPTLKNLLKKSFSKLPPPDTTEADQDYYNKRQKLPRGYRWFGPWANTNNYKIKEMKNEPDRIDEIKRKLKKSEIKATTPTHETTTVWNRKDMRYEGENEKEIVKALDKEIFLKNKQKSESFVHHADFLLPKIAENSNGNETYLSMANYRINMIQKMSNNSFPILRTSTAAPEGEDFFGSNTTMPIIKRIKCANSLQKC